MASFHYIIALETKDLPKTKDLKQFHHQIEHPAAKYQLAIAIK